MATAEEILRAIAEKVGRDHYRHSMHSQLECTNDQITDEDLRAALSAPELLEDYPNDKRGPSALVLGLTASGEPIHVVVGRLFGPEKLVIITAYRPKPEEWIDWRRRR